MVTVRSHRDMRHDSVPESLPTFLGIGSMRCGSTWLYEVLKRHPDIQVSEFKEVDFFFMKRMMRHDLNWYEELFDAGDGAHLKPVRGEISPGYARLKVWQVNRIAGLLPRLRILLTLRHPIERMWSQTLYTLGHLRGKDIRNINSLELLQQLERARSRLSSDYVRIVKTWTAAFGRDALHIGFFDNLRADPESFVNGVLEHIGASTPWPLPEELTKKKIWSTNSLVKHERGIPELVHWYMAARLLQPTIRLNELLEGRVSNWVSELRTIRGRTRLSWRILREVNRSILSLPERLAYETYHTVLDVRMWLRWRQLERAYGSGHDLVL